MSLINYSYIKYICIYIYIYIYILRDQYTIYIKQVIIYNAIYSLFLKLNKTNEIIYKIYKSKNNYNTDSFDLIISIIKKNKLFNIQI